MPDGVEERGWLDRVTQLEAAWNLGVDAMAISDADGIVLAANPAYFRLYAISPGEAIGRPFPLYFAPEERAAALARYHAVFHGPESFGLFERVVRRHDGVVLVVESRTSFLLRDGERVALVSLIRDITERKRVEAALRDSEEHFRRIFEDAPIGIGLVSPDFRLVQVNRALAEMLGRSVADLVGQSFLAGTHPDDVAAHADLAGRLFAGEIARYQLDKRFLTPDGRVVVGRVTCNALRDTGGTPIYALGMVENITEHKLLEQQLRQAQKMEAVGRLAGGVAHDFNNMLSVILGHAELVRLRSDLDPDLRRSLDEIHAAAERSAALTQQLLTFSRKEIVTARVVDLNAVVREIDALLRRIIGEDVRLETRLHPAAGHVRADPSQLQQMVVNLAVNARDAMPGGGTLTIATAPETLAEPRSTQHAHIPAGQYVALTVADTGYGMDAGMLKHLFEPFFTTKGVGRGTGLGLATVYATVRQCQGHIEVDSAPGTGARFRIFLPAVTESGAAAAPARAAVPVHGIETVLVVEDEEAVRRLTCEVLRQHGYRVLEACDGVDALAVAERHAGVIDLLLVDVVMPELTGPEVAERLSARQADLRVLYTSGYTDDEVLRRGITAAQVEFLQKPFRPQDLVQKVRSVLDAPAQAAGTGSSADE